ncbi:hypothetical protein BpHYR1_037684 [Brachionus plicatilis]|uniref:Uncharacterized protein n=1 Tax=Brachionus plicatilis TaxID=10195 RepID=A0A3M7QLD8_BRAPC|nr:hypothetical protein BpHYR1_037684 [Brachionus plicatilis]
MLLLFFKIIYINFTLAVMGIIFLTQNLSKITLTKYIIKSFIIKFQRDNSDITVMTLFKKNKPKCLNV